MKFNTKNKRTILVTGGNRGIGLAIVKGLAKDKKNHVLLGCRSVLYGEEEAKKLSGNITVVPLDLEKETLEKHIKNIQKKHPRIDVLINNAAISDGNTYIMGKTLEEVLWVNTLAPLELIKAIAPIMAQNKYGRIVNVSSGCGAFSNGLSGPIAYSISKAALNALTLTASREVSKSVKINCMCPGWVRTRMGGMNATRSPEEGAETAIWLANLDEKGPTGSFFRDKKRIPW